jgi:hypothetical protein
LLPCAGVRIAILGSTVLALAACNMGTLGDGRTYQDTSPGTVTLRLDLSSTRSFCDQVPNCGPTVAHVTLEDATGRPFQLSSGLCSFDCSNQCQPHVCPPVAILCIQGGGYAVTQVQQTWDGMYYEPGTCGLGTSCVSKRFVPPGRYTAHFCVTPGTVSGVQGDVTAPPATCTATGPEECVDVPFELPGPPVVEATLPDTAQ